MRDSMPGRVSCKKGAMDRTEALRARGLRPIGELAASRNHGDRLRYLAGCKCQDCRGANSRYESMRNRARRNGDWNGIIKAFKARRHILSLSRRGIGRKAVAAASGVASSAILEIRTRRKLHIRARTERKILDVTKEMASDRALVSARRTWKLIRMLRTEGYETKYLANQLRYKYAALQFGKEQVTVRNAYRVDRLYHRLMD